MDRGIVEAIRDWCKARFQPLGNYAASGDIPTKVSELENDKGYLDAVQGEKLYIKIEEQNITKEQYISEGFDDKISKLSFVKEHPSGVFGHSSILSNMGIGDFVNVISYSSKQIGEISQIAYGEKGMAKRYFNHTNSTWTQWAFFPNDLNNQIDQINSDMLKNSERYLALQSQSLEGISEYPKHTGVFRCTGGNINWLPGTSSDQYGTLIIAGYGYYMNLFINSNQNMYFAMTIELEPPTEWKKISVGDYENLILDSETSTVQKDRS